MPMDIAPSLPPVDHVIAWAEKLYTEAVDRKDAAGFARAFSRNGTIRFGNNPEVRGREQIESAIAQFFTTFKSLTHQSSGARLAEDTLFLEAVVTYTRHDDRRVSVPAMTVFHLAGVNDTGAPVADDCRIYVDLTPLYAP